METTKFDIPAPKDENSVADQFIALVDTIKILRIGCPWDRKQTNDSIAHLLIEEAYETIDSIYHHDDPEFSKELGDLLLHVIMHSIMAEERNAFNLTDVLVKIRQKLVHRHPHVFGDVEVKDEEDVMDNWEALKLKEGRVSTLDGVPLNLPSLLRAQRIQHKASRVGFDWDDKTDVWKKVEEEIGELKHEILNKNTQKASEELGDLLFAIVNAARFEDIVAEEALHLANNKFTARFKYIEEKAAMMNRKLNDMTLAEMDTFWDEAKLLEKNLG